MNNNIQSGSEILKEFLGLTSEERIENSIKSNQNKLKQLETADIDVKEKEEIKIRINRRLKELKESK